MVVGNDHQPVIGVEGKKIRQVGIIVKDAPKTARRYSKIFGIGPWVFYDIVPSDVIFHDKPLGDHVSSIRIAMAKMGKMQIELLRVLESKTFVRVGGNKEISSDFRVICATNRDLKSMVESGTFREDLYYRLNVVNINVPPLRERPEDIPMLVTHFIRKYCTSMSRDVLAIENQALEYLKGLEFAGNVRELENMIERAIVIGNGKEIRLKDFPHAKNNVGNSVENLEDIERKHIHQILEKYSWNISRSAKALRIDRVTLYNKIKKYKLEK